MLIEALRRYRSYMAVPAVALGLLMPLAQYYANRERCSLNQHWAADQTALALLSRQPPGALLISSYFQTGFSASALQATMDLRPDVDLLHRNYLHQPGYLETLRQRLPRLSDAASQWHRAGRLTPRLLDRLATTRAVSIEYDLNLPQDVTDRLSPAGLTFDYREAAQGDRQRHQELVASWMQAVAPVTELETRRALVWTHYLLARFGCRRRLQWMTSPHLSSALRLSPRAEQLIELRRSCLSPSP